MLEEICELIQANKYPLEYNPRIWESYPLATCYTYALGLHINEGFMLGDFIGNRVTYRDSPEVQKSILLEELTRLGFWIAECETDSCSLEPGSFKLYVEWDERNYYHFIREDNDGLWSHKQAGCLPTRRDQAGYLIDDPDGMMNSKFCYGQCYMLYH